MAAPFVVRATDDPRAHAHPVPEADSALEAALLFAERWLAHAEAEEVSVTVVECETGREQCFRIDLGAHTAGPC
jgi:hypothetical protein